MSAGVFDEYVSAVRVWIVTLEEYANDPHIACAGEVLDATEWAFDAATSMVGFLSVDDKDA